MKSVSKEQYLEYLKEHPVCRMQNIADYFGVKKSLVASHFMSYGIHLRDICPLQCHGHSIEEITEYASTHTMKEIVAHYDWPPIQSFVNRHHIPHLREEKIYPEYHRESRRGRKCDGSEFEMMYILSRYFNLATIGKAFGVSREWIRIVCDDFDSGKRVLTIKEGVENE